MNEELREHVSGGFSLHLPKTGIAAMVYVREEQARGEDISLPYGSPWNHFVGGFRVCQSRGLMIHHMKRVAPPGRMPHPTWEWITPYDFTAAGEFVLGLLWESGIYQDYAALLPQVSEAVA